MTLSVEDLPLSQLDDVAKRAVCSAVLRAAREQLAEGQEVGTPAEQLLRQLSDELDALLRALCAGALPAGMPVSVVALGGYGRRELYPYSDLDLLFLYRQAADEEAIAALVQDVVYPLWDAKLSVGHAARLVSETLELASSDLAMRTALLDARLLAGDRELFEELVAGGTREFFGTERVNQFVEQLAGERAERHARFGESIFLLEPNIKSSKGGLRDINTALWAAKARFGAERFADLAGHGAATARQVTTLSAAHDFLRDLRLELHLDAGRAQDQLVFEVQERLAPRRYADGEIPGARHLAAKAPVAPAVERLMHAFYRHAQAAVVETEGILERCQVPDDEAPPQVERIDERFVAVGDWLSCPSPEAFWQEPAEILRAFQLAHERGLRLDRPTRDAIAEAIAGVPGSQLQADALAAERWLALLCEENLARGTLRAMHDIGLIAAVIPEFGPCTGRVQHDIYHVYTVDQHTLFVVARLHALRRGERCTPTTRPAEVIAEIAEPMPLYLGALLHDVAKPLGSGHARRGARLAAGVVARLGLPRAQQELVVFLVREHLTMSHISQRRDLGDPEVIAAFAELVGDVHRLRAVYLLTVADTAMTCPGNLSEWKASLLDELYQRTLRHLELGASEAAAPEVIEQRRGELRRLIEAQRGEAAAGVAGRLPDRLLAGEEVGELDHHLAVLASLAQRPGARAAIGARADGESGTVELTVACDDAPGLLATITGVLVLERITVLAAKIYTLPGDEHHGPAALDIFTIEPPAAHEPTETWRRLENLLDAALRGELDVEGRLDDRLRGGRGSGLLGRAMPPVSTSVTFDNDASRQWTVIEIRSADSPGLLHLVTRALWNLGLEIELALIATEHGSVVDTFYVQDHATGGKITDEKQQQTIVARLTQAVEVPAINEEGL